MIIPAKLRDGFRGAFRHNKRNGKLPVCISGRLNGTPLKKNLTPYQPPQIRNARAFAYFFQGSAADGELDKQGRTLIPAVLRTYAKLDKEVVFIGMGKRAEIWDKARWDEKNAEVEA